MNQVIFCFYKLSICVLVCNQNKIKIIYKDVNLLYCNIYLTSFPIFAQYV